MQTGQGETQSLPIHEIDRNLACNPFGDNIYIAEQMHLSYLRRLTSLSRHLPVALALHDAVGRAGSDTRLRVLGDTTLRCAIQHAQVQCETGAAYGLPLAECESVLEEALHAVREGDYRLFSDAGTVWDPGCPDSVHKHAFSRLLRMDFDGELPCAPDADELATLRQGAELLGLLLPHSSRSALSHARQVVVFPEMGAWRTRTSSSEFRLSGTIFLNRRVLRNPWVAAEHLYHESLHQQFYDFRAGHSLLQPTFARAGAPLIHSPWNRPDATGNNYWDVHRAVAAFHVYVHLALLCIAADQHPALRETYGPVRLVGRRTALLRAHYLGEQIRKVVWSELGAAGQRFVEWFGLALELLDPAPPAAGADAHLLLDRYWREANSVRALPVEQAWQQRLAALAENELRSTHRILADMCESTDAFDATLARLPRNDPSEYFASARDLIANAILDAAPADYRLSASGIADGLVRQMVEASSDVLQALLERDREAATA